MNLRAVLEVLSPGAMASIQDRGRFGWRRIGVPRSGALEPGWLRLANALLGNPEDAPAIEFLTGGLAVRALQWPLQLALAGHFTAELRYTGGRRRIASWRSVCLAPGETLHCGSIAAGRVGYLALVGLVVLRHFGSASTYARAGLGGVDGRPLVPGVRLSVAAGGGGERMLWRPPAVDEAAIRVVAGPQDDHFDVLAMPTLVGEAYRISPAADRMGIRLDGPLLGHRPEKGAEIVSDATVPGSIQVPGNGQPIVLLADGQTAGGYPKIATVISADLPRLAVMAPGQAVRFAAVSVAAAEEAARARQAELQALLAGIGPLVEPGEHDPQALYTANLISGAVDATAADGSPMSAYHLPGEP
ncbi:MAG: biotin-dependent carboxyltransferase family protein [Accumulibacter sp.]|uniref:5-oxoprolinase subunit C family protein n=1 Tax=Accumulibacter sp. TaxID=2053492 RepID=UPI002FC32D37